MLCLKNMDKKGGKNMEMLNQKQKVIAMAAIAIIIIIVGYYYINSTKEIYDYAEIDSNNEVQENNDEEIEEEKMIVHITGGVKKQGIVEVKENARINDAIEAAGGITGDADLSNVNLAYKIEDGQKLYIPKIEDKNQTNIVSEEAGANVLTANEEAIKSTYIDINKASAEQLEKIPGIGSQTAQKIIEYRTQNGKFKNIEDIKNVSGIGDAKFETIKNFIRV